MISSCKGLLKCRKDVYFRLQDHRCEETLGYQDPITDDQRISISLDIVRSPRAGVACALNHGLAYCHADVVARMDADDVATPHRLLSQIRFIRANPSFAAVGTSTVLFSENQTASGKSDNEQYSNLILPYDDLAENSGSRCVLRPSLSISDPGFMAWAMFFTCSISHPSVVFRRNIVRELGGYDETISHCEDYELWLRLLNRNCKSIVCLPFVGIWHRKHNQSSSSVGLKIQKKEADKACCRAIEQTLHLTNDDNGPLSFDQVSILRNPSSAQSSESLDIAAKLLLRLETSFLTKNYDRLTRQEIALVKLDCNARIGELATIIITKFGNEDKTGLDHKGGAGMRSFAWKSWCERCPEKQLERLSLICHTRT